MQLDFQSQSWDSAAHVSAFCSIAADGTTVRDKVIISHGTGREMGAESSAQHECEV